MAQKTSPYVIINSLSEQISPNYFILDSLVALKRINLTKKDFQFLTKEDKKEIKKSLRFSSNGFKLTKDSLIGKKLYSASIVFRSFLNNDSLDEKEIERIQPFYIISNPLFFEKETKVIIEVMLTQHLGYMYILEKKNDKWEVVKTIYEWMS